MTRIALNTFNWQRYSLSTFALAAMIFSFEPAFASTQDVVVTAPGVNTQVSSPFSLQAQSATCSGQPVAAMGYSIDDSSQTQIINETSLSVLELAGTGSHVLHVKSWGSQGSSCLTSINMTIVPGSSIPPGVTVSSNLQRLNTWISAHDAGTNGSSRGSTSLTSTPSLSGQGRQFAMNFENNGGEIFSASFGADTLATHFVYDAQVLLSSTSQLANLEMDVNQVLANGETVIYGVQCDGWSQTWDYTLNMGTAAAPVDTWVHSNLPCNPQTWTPNAWHHVQIAYSRDAVGNVTYESVTLDGAESNFVGATGNSAFALGWAPTLLTNFQLDGRGNGGAVTGYLDDVTVYRW
jgi:hypothetical protein